MIAWLSGYIIAKPEPGIIILNVNGVGYLLETSLNTFFNLGENTEKINLYVQTIVREDAILLYGFIDQEERSLFKALIKVNGIGPKSAMSILSSITPSEFIQCIFQENSALLTKLPGIGTKTASRLIIEMRDNLKKITSNKQEGCNINTTSSINSLNEAICALEALGYKSQEANKVVSKIDTSDKSSQQIIREALQLLANKR